MKKAIHLIMAWLALGAVTSSVSGQRLSQPADLAQVTPSGTAEGAIVSMPVEPGMLMRTFIAAGQNRQRWLASFCDAVLPLKGEDYERFVRLVREEVALIEVYYEEPVRATSVTQSLDRFVTNETRSRFIQCLEHWGDDASPQAKFDLFLIIYSLRQGFHATLYQWLKKAADGRHSMAEYLMAERILNQSSDPRVRALIPAEEHDRKQLFLAYLRSAAQSGIPQAQYLLGALNLRGSPWGGAVEDVPQAIEWLKLAASQSRHSSTRYHAAQLLGTAYFDGEPVAQNYEEAFRWYTLIPKEKVVGIRAPWGGVGGRLYQMYCQGLGVQRDPAMAQSYSRANVPCP
jgi:hypothetical protein